jgi:hypothetical protein
MFLHGHSVLTARRAVHDSGNFVRGQAGGRFGFRFRTWASARCALPLGDGPRALGFSISKEKLNHEIGNCE